jgi:CDP-diacylglycerol--glycerol-3-phosphate 3-phosphatidyltransferase
VRGWLRLAYLAGREVARLGATPTAVTGVGLALSLLVPVAAGWRPAGPLLAAVLVLLSAVADTVDGAVAVIADRASRLGHVYDSLADRISEACWLVALWILGAPAWLLLVGGGLSWLHEYLRARAAAAGLAGVAVVTVAERPTRIIVAVAGLLAGGVATVAAVAGAGAVAGSALVALVSTVAAAAWAALAAVGFVQLFVAVRRALRAPRS